MPNWMSGVKILAALMVADLVAGAANGQEPSQSDVEAIFQDVSQPRSPGCALAVARGGKTIYEKGYGLANIEENVAITPQTVFDIGSTSKQFTAASILLLEQQGKLSVHDDIRKYLPEIPDYGQNITILNLLNHTSGLRDYLELFELAGVNIDSVTTDRDALAIIANQKALNFEPGSEWLYSNSGFFLLSVIVKRVSGERLAQFAAQNIFAPLEMKSTVYRDDHTQIVPNRALAYDQKKDGGFAINVSYFEQTGDGAVHTSVEDLLKWDENFYTGKVGGKGLITKLQQPGKLNSGKELDYAKGLSLGKYRGLAYVAHGGSWGGYRAQLLRFPEQHFSVVCLCNLGNANPSKRANQVATLYLKDAMKEAAAPARDDESTKKKETVGIPAEKLAAFAGRFHSNELRATYVLAITDGKLALKEIEDDGFLHSAQHFELRPVGEDRFVVDAQELEFAFTRDAAAGTVNGFRMDAGRIRGVVFERR